VTPGCSGLWITLRLAVLVGAAYFALTAWTMGGKWLANGSFLPACSSYASLCAFLLLPPRLICRQWWTAFLALPFPVWWIFALIDDGLRGADFGGMMILHIPLLIQAGLVGHCRSTAVARYPRRGSRGPTVQQVHAAGGPQAAGG